MRDNYNDMNGEVIEEFMDMKNLVCVNNGDSTRINVINWKETAVNISLVSESIAGKLVGS